MTGAKRKRPEKLRDTLSGRLLLDPITKAFFESLEQANVSLFMLDALEARRYFSELQSIAAPRPEADVEDVTLCIGAAGPVPVRIVRPLPKGRVLPAILFLHGGGWIMGDRLSYDRLIRELAVGSDAALFFVDYTLSPEAQFPGQNEQAYAALASIAANASRYGIDASRMAVVGDGSGGNMAAATALITNLRNGPSLALQVLLYPILSDVSDNLSYRNFADITTLTAADVAYFLDNYLPGLQSHQQITAFPLKASIQELSGVASALIVAAEYDILQQENEEYARKLAAAGVSVNYRCYRGALHGFVTLDALAGSRCARAALRQTTRTLHKVLHSRS